LTKHVAPGFVPLSPPPPGAIINSSPYDTARVPVICEPEPPAPPVAPAENPDPPPPPRTVICKPPSKGTENSHGSQEEAGKVIETNGAADAGALAAKGKTTPSNARAPNGPSTRLALVLGASQLPRDLAKPKRLVRDPSITPPIVLYPIPGLYLLLSLWERKAPGCSFGGWSAPSPLPPSHRVPVSYIAFDPRHRRGPFVPRARHSEHARR
jgi:hypothetical protein